MGKTKTRQRFDFVALENAALQSWKEWDQHDSVENRVSMFKKIQELTFAVIYAGDFEKKFKIRLGNDADDTAEKRINTAATEYAVYLFERIVTRSKTFPPKEDYIDVVLAAKAKLSDASIATAVRKTVKQPFDVLGYEPAKVAESKYTTDEGKPIQVSVVDGKIVDKKGKVYPGKIVDGYRVHYKFHKFALQPYINQNLRHVLLSRKDDYGTYELLDSLEASLQSGEDPVDHDLYPSEEMQQAERFSKKHLGRQVYRTLRLFYDDAEIRRLYPITVELIYRNERGLVDAGLPDDVQDFATVLLGVAKRLSRENYGIDYGGMKKKDFDAAILAATRSSIFLASVASTDCFDRSLLLALDIESLYRMATLLGGKKVQVPTLRELDTLVGATAAVSDALVKGRDPEAAIRDAKTSLGLVFSHKINLKKFVVQALEAHSVHGPDQESRPVVNTLLQAISALERTFEGIVERSKTADARELAELYNSMLTTTTRFSEALVTAAGEGRKLLEKDE